ncbi:MAG: matrixin family metalloprotease [Pseudomonadota bacterium]
MSSATRHGPAVACLAWLLLSTPAAQAFCRTNTCDASRGDQCTVDKDGCRLGGKPLYWAINPVPFLVQGDGSPKNHIDATTFETLLASAFNTWSTANCGQGKHPTISAMSGGQTPVAAAEYLPGQANANIFMFRDDTWMASTPGSALALTTVSYDFHTGEIYDADVEVNGTGGHITDGRPSDGADLPSIMTHEIGHFIGLDHSPKKTATMYISYEAGKGDLRSLDADDIAAVCTVYPPKGKTADSSGEVDVSEAPLAGCSLSSPQQRRSGAASWLPLAIAGLLGMRRARRPNAR